MTLGDKINKEVMAWASVAVVIVVASLILLKIKTANIGYMTCDWNHTYVAALNQCNNGTANISINEVALTTDSFIAAFAEPKNWIAIVIIALIGFALLKYYKGKQGR